MDTYSLVASQIIREQQVIIGPIALDQARKINGLEIKSIGDVHVVGNGKEILTNLVKQYATLFGQASIEVCRDAVKEVQPKVPPDELPDVLK